MCRVLDSVKEAVIYEPNNRLYLQEMARIFVNNLFHILFFRVLFTLAEKNKMKNSLITNYSYMKDYGSSVN